MQGEKKAVDWTLSAFNLEKVSRRSDGQLELDGVRVAVRYNPDQHVFERHPLKDDKVKILLAADKPELVQPALAAIFSVGIDPELQRSMPSYWSHYFIPSLPWPADALTGQTVFAANGTDPAGLVFPVPEKKPEPGFTAEAEKDHVLGAVLVRMDVDEDGVPRRIVIRQPLGYGLDARTIETLVKYRFKPGTLEGKPVPVEMTVEQQFR
jgi:TonB family protein